MRTKEMTINLVNLFVTVVEVTLVLRFVFLLFAANQASGFVGWIYSMSATLLQPFRGIFPATVFPNHHVFEFSTLFAMVVYGVFGLLALEVVRLLSSGVTVSKKK